MDNPIKKDTVTIQDIADKLEISISTVSRALKNNPRISKKTKDEVWQAARELGYQLNTSSYLYDIKSTKNIGIIVPEINNPLYIDIIKKVQKDARQKEYNTIVSYSQESPDIEAEIIKNFIQLNLDGIIISLAGDASKSQHLNDIIVSGIPLVCINNVNFNIPTPKIIIDAHQGTYKAVKHLVSVGCKKIVLMLGNDEPVYYQEMLNGYKTGLTSSGIHFEKDLLVRCQLSTDDVSHVLKTVFSKTSFPDAIITANNISALQSIAYLKSINIRVPYDVSVISFGSDPNKLYSPSITSIHYSHNDISISALTQLFELIEKRKTGKAFHDKTIITPVRLIIRGSSMRD